MLLLCSLGGPVFISLAFLGVPGKDICLCSVEMLVQLSYLYYVSAFVLVVGHKSLLASRESHVPWFLSTITPLVLYIIALILNSPTPALWMLKN